MQYRTRIELDFLGDSQGHVLESTILARLGIAQGEDLYSSCGTKDTLVTVSRVTRIEPPSQDVAQSS